MLFESVCCLVPLLGYELRQSTSTQLIPSLPADQPWIQSDEPCPALPLLWDIAGQCKPTPDGGNYYCYYHHYYYYYIYYYYYKFYYILSLKEHLNSTQCF